VVGVPVVASANIGKRLVAVVVSLAKDAPETIAAHEAVVPLVVKYLPELDVWLGASASNAAVAVVCPVPPLAIANVPPRLTAPVVAVFGVRPVLPALNEVTPPVDAAHAAVVPSLVSTYPFKPMPKRVELLLPLPRIKSPVVVMGDKALKAADAVVCPVPPFATGRVPVMPVDKGRPVALVKVADEGVPKAPPLTTKAPAEPTLTAKAVATLVPKPLTPVDIGRSVALVSVADVGVPNIGVTSVGLVANTKDPDPVSSVTAVIKFEEEGVAKKVATPAPKPLMPVDTGRPVALVKVADDGVPKAGVTSVGLVANTNEPLPVSSVTAAAKLAEEGVAKRVATPVPNPLIPVETGRPVALVRVTEVGVPNTGVTNVGLVDITTLPVPVMALLTSPLEASVNTA
jgi:hypothetical protein